MNGDDGARGHGLKGVDPTVFIPNPGGRRRDTGIPQPQARAAAQEPAPSTLPPELEGFAESGGRNPLLESAAPLLALFTRILRLRTHADANAITAQAVEQVRSFEADARALGVSREAGFSARYVLCTALDEAALRHEWAQRSAWGARNLLLTFHKDSKGGTRFFELLDVLDDDVPANIDLLELMYVVLALGFQGQYAVSAEGRESLEVVRERLYRKVRAHRGDIERELSPQWAGVQPVRNPLVDYLPVWVVGALAAALLAGAYVFFSVRLSASTEQVAGQLHALAGKVLTVERKPYVASPPKPLIDLPTLLREEIARGQLGVENQPEGQVITLAGDDLFRSGSSTVNEAYHALLARIGDAILRVDGQAVVAGHTDNVPIRTARFPSNFVLSQARADGVRELLVGAMGGDEAARLEARGMGDSQPLTDNRTRADRARNRRVEILVSYRTYATSQLTRADAVREASEP